jgi:hypothetical protein
MIGESLQTRVKMWGVLILELLQYLQMLELSKITWWLELLKRRWNNTNPNIVVCIFRYLMGYVEEGQWDTYSNGSWEFRATYVCIELRLGAYPFQKFRRYHGVRNKLKSNGRVKYEPVVYLNGGKIYFQEQETKEQAAFIRDVAKFCLSINGRHDYNFDPDLYAVLPQIPNNLSHDEIKSLVLEHAKHHPTWNHLTANASTDPSNTPTREATTAGFYELIGDIHNNQFQEVVDVEGGVRDVNGDYATPHGVEHTMIPRAMSDIDVQGKLHHLKTSINEYEHVHNDKIMCANFLEISFSLITMIFYAQLG